MRLIHLTRTECVRNSDSEVVIGVHSVGIPYAFGSSRGRV